MQSRSDRPWREELKDLFAMHRGERRAFFILLTACGLAAAWVTYEQAIRSDRVADEAGLRVAWESLQADTAQPRTTDHDREVTLFAFDPNGLPTEQWMMLGLTERQAEAIHRYEERGGRFRTKADLAKMRVVDPALFTRWEPYVQLPDRALKEDPIPRAERSDPQQDRPSWGKDRSDRPPVQRVEINTADSVQLVALPGIGPAFARGILKFRDRLGGFHDLDQLGEVYILRDKPEAVERLKALLLVDTAHVHRFPLNTFTAEELGPHPYASWKLAKALVAYRKQHGGFARREDIRGCALVTDSIFVRLAPYLEEGR